MKADDAVLYQLKNVTYNAYMSDVKRRNQEGGPITSFLVDTIAKNLEEDYERLLNDRESKVRELKNCAADGASEKNKFTENLKRIKNQLLETRQLSTELHQSTSKISKDFSSVADQLDFTTSLVSKAEEMQIHIKFIQEFNKKDAQDTLEERLIAADFPDDPYSCAELISRLIKIVSSAENDKQIDRQNFPIKDNLAVAKKNLEAYKEDLTQELLKTFLSENSESSVVQNKCANALAFLQREQDAVKAFIDSIPLMTDQTNNIKFNPSILEKSESEQIERYAHLCNYFYTQCIDLWKCIDAIFDKNQQPKTVLVQTVWIEVFSPFVINVLTDASKKGPERFCSTLYSMHKESFEMMNKIWKLNNQVFSAANIIDKVFESFQEEYEVKENEFIMNEMNAIAQPAISRYRAYIDKARKVTLFKNDEEKYNIFDDFDNGLPITILIKGADAWERCISLAPSEKDKKSTSPNDMQDMLSSLIDIIVQSNFRDLLSTYLEACNVYMEKESDLSIVDRYITITATFNTALLTLDEKYNLILKDNMSPSQIDSFTRNKNSLIKSFETSITRGLEKCIEIIVKKIESIVNTEQFKNQYSGANVDVCISPSCSEICRIIGSPGKGIIGAIDILTVENRRSFAAVLTKRILDVLIKALKKSKFKFPFGTTSFLLDVAEYNTAFSYFNLTTLDTKMNDIQIAAKLLCEKPENISETKDILNVSHYALELARDLIINRDDAKKENLISKL